MAYNGWTNYETWAVALWVDNDEGTYHARCEIVDEVREEHKGDDDELTKDSEAYSDAEVELARRLQEWVESEMLPDLGASLAGDLLGAAMSGVNWREIAENWLDE